jgi:uncharacterized membrane protein
MPNQKILMSPFYLIAATFVGIGDTLFLSYYHLLGVIPGCALKGCEIVLSSPYTMVGGPKGIAFAFLGLIYYAYMLALAILLAIEPKSFALRWAALLYTGVGLVCSIGFELFQYFVIHALCMYCGISAVTTLVLFCLALWHWQATNKYPVAFGATG